MNDVVRLAMTAHLPSIREPGKINSMPASDLRAALPPGQAWGRRGTPPGVPAPLAAGSPLPLRLAQGQRHPRAAPCLCPCAALPACYPCAVHPCAPPATPHSPAVQVPLPRAEGCPVRSAECPYPVARQVPGPQTSALPASPARTARHCSGDIPESSASRSTRPDSRR